MTKEEFEKYSDEGKTVVCLQYVEGEPDKSLVCSNGDIEGVTASVLRMVITSIFKWSKERNISAVKLAKVFAKYIVKYVKKYKDEL